MWIHRIIEWQKQTLLSSEADKSAYGDRGMRLPLKPGRRKPSDKCRVPGKTGGSLAEGDLRVSGGALIKVLSGAVNVWRPDRIFHFRIKILKFQPIP